MKEDKQYILNLIDSSKKFENNKYKTDIIVMEYNSEDKNSLYDIESRLKNNKSLNKNSLIYLVNIRFSSKNKNNIISFDKFSDYRLKYFSITSHNDKDIIKLFNDLISNLNNITESSIINNYKIVMVGDTVAGKTCLSRRIKGSDFSSHILKTIGTDFVVIKQRSKTGKELKFITWDTPANERFFVIGKSCLKGSDCAILMYDITHEDSFYYWIKERWYPTIVVEFKQIKLIYLIGNKIDQEENRIVDKEEVLEFAKENNLKYFEISCKNNTGVKRFLYDLFNETSKIEKYKPKNTVLKKKKKK